MGREYTFDGIAYPSVTTILGLLDKPYLLPWAAEQGAKYVLDHISKEGIQHTIEHSEPVLESARLAHTKVSGAAKDIGSDVHKLIETYIKRKLSGSMVPIELQDYCEEVVACWSQFLLWELALKPYWIETEQQVLNQADGFAGTLDAVCDIDGKIYVIDFKTDKQISDTYPLQISAYQSAYNLSGGRATNQGILRLPKNGDPFEWVDYSDKYERSLMAFRGLLMFYYNFKKRRLKDNPVIKRIWG